MLNIVIPMAGRGQRFTQAGYSKPKPFIDVNGKPMIERVLENLYYPNARYILILQESHLVEEKQLLEALERRFNIVFLPISNLTEGTAMTILYARRYINSDEPLLIANADQIVDIRIEDFINDAQKRGVDGSILVFEDRTEDRKWSYVKIDEQGWITEVKEKEPISTYATVGIYYYHKGREYVNAAIDMMVANDRVNGEFYTCPTYNYAIKDGLKIGIYMIESIQMHGLGTPEDLKEYLALLKH